MNTPTNTPTNAALPVDIPDGWYAAAARLFDHMKVRRPHYTHRPSTVLAWRVFVVKLARLYDPYAGSKCHYKSDAHWLHRASSAADWLWTAIDPHADRADTGSPAACIDDAVDLIDTL